MRCLACTSAQLKVLIQGDIYQHSTISSLRKSADDGCESCRFFFVSLAQIGSFDNKHERCELVLRYENAHPENTQYSTGALQLLLFDAGAQAGEALVAVEFEICGYSGDVTLYPSLLRMAGRLLDRRFSEQRCQDLARGWFSRCQETHDSCLIDGDAPRPTRLLRVKMDSSPRIRLIVSNTLPKVKYVALSHCWGKLSILTTTSKNLSGHLEHIPFNALPQNFQDAAVIINAMGVGYLWVDSLCILQDSKEDWEKESALMGQVYENASFTIAADSSTNSHGGILHEREHANKVHMFFPQETGLMEEDLYLRLPLKQFRDIDDEPLNTRGWTCQERILSARVLHFTKEQIFWECRNCVWAEGSSDSLQDPMLSYSKRYHDNRKTKLPPAPPGFPEQNIDRTHRPEAWYMSIVSFSSRRLTYPSDKLPAISGLARNFCNPNTATGGDYLAGLWENDFIRSMGWVNATSLHDAGNLEQALQESEDLGRVLELTKAETYRAPSFSWSAYDGPIAFPRNDIFPLGDEEVAALFWVDDVLRRYREHRSRSKLFNIEFLESHLVNSSDDLYGSLHEKSYILVEATCLGFSYDPKTEAALCGGKVPCVLSFDIAAYKELVVEYTYIQLSREVPVVKKTSEVERVCTV